MVYQLQARAIYDVPGTESRPFARARLFGMSGSRRCVDDVEFDRTGPSGG